MCDMVADTTASSLSVSEYVFRMFTSSHACTTASGGGVEAGGFCPPIEEDTEGPEHSLRLVPLPQQRNVVSYLSNAPKAVWAGLDLGCRHRPGHGTIS